MTPSGPASVVLLCALCLLGCGDEYVTYVLPEAGAPEPVAVDCMLVPTGTLCNAGACEPVNCTVDRNCPAPFACVGGVCAEARAGQ